MVHTKDRSVRATMRDAFRRSPGPPKRHARHLAAAGRWAAVGATALLVTACSSLSTTGRDDSSPSPSSSAAPSADKPPPTSARPLAPMPPEVAARLDTAITAILSTSRIPGATIGVWAPQGTYLKGFGVADRQSGRPMDPATLMRIGSETKTFTVTALLRLVDQGKFSLDDPIGRFIPDVPGGDAITIRHLAGMRSGLPTYLSNPSFARKFLADPTRQYSAQELLDYAFAQPPLFPPGTAFNYSNTNTILLGRLIEHLSGQSLATYLQANVLGPLKLGATSYPVDTALPSPHAHGYTTQTADGQEVDATGWNPSIAGAAGAMISNGVDLGVWAKALVDGDLLAPATRAQRLQFVPELPDNPEIAYGLGLYRNHGWTGHDGGIPGYQSLTLYLPEAQTALVILLIPTSR